MSTPQDGLANVIADVSFTIAVGALTLKNSFQVPPPVAGQNAGTILAGGQLVGIRRVSPGIVDLAIDAGKGSGPSNVGSSLQVEFSVSYTGSLADGTVPMMHTVKESGAVASTPTVRVYRFQFFAGTIANGNVDILDPALCTITIRRKKELYPQ